LISGGSRVSNNGWLSNKLKEGKYKVSRPIDLAHLIAKQILEPQLGDMVKQANYVMSIAGPVGADNRTLIRYTNVFSEKDSNIPLAKMIENIVSRQNKTISTRTNKF